MTDQAQVLTQTSPLGGFEVTRNGTSLMELCSLSLVSVSPMAGGEDGFKIAIEKLFNKATPAGSMTLIDEGCFLMPSAHNQWFFGNENYVSDPLSEAVSAFGKVTSKRLAMTDQSDAWAVLQLTGRKASEALQHLCQLDCRNHAMPVGATARTMMAHLSVIITRRPDTSEGSASFWLFTPRSSALSFLTAILAVPPFSG
jgi:heterotetrameric sarcosine oxidase gamma subunit